MTKGKGRGKGRGKFNLTQPDIQHEEDLQSLQREPESDALSECGEGTSTGKRPISSSYNFSAGVEQKLVEFYEEHSCYYDKVDPKVSGLLLHDPCIYHRLLTISRRRA
jgi:hypothetical protein